MEKWLILNKIFNIEQWESLQDALVDATKMAIIMVNHKGEQVTKHSGCQNFCYQVRSDEKFKKYCQKCDARAGFEALGVDKPYIYRCHFSIVDMAIPITINERYIGAILVGQVRLAENEEDKLEQILHPTDKKSIEEKKQELADDYNNLPIISLGRIKVIANMMFYLCNYISSESAKKLQFAKQGELTISETMEYYVEDIEEKEEKSEINTYVGDRYENYHGVIKKVIEYIFANKEQRPSLSDLARYCYVSESYISHLFAKEVGESYSSFITNLRINWAKSMLETDDASVTEISEKLGYNETSYFIKVFKKQVGVTPLAYKNILRSKKSRA